MTHTAGLGRIVERGRWVAAAVALMLMAIGCGGGGGGEPPPGEVRTVSGQAAEGAAGRRALSLGHLRVVALSNRRELVVADVADDGRFEITLEVGHSYLIAFIDGKGTESLEDDAFVATLAVSLPGFQGALSSVLPLPAGGPVDLGTVTLTGTFALPASDPLLTGAIGTVPTSWDLDNNGIDDREEFDLDGNGTPDPLDYPNELARLSPAGDPIQFTGRLVDGARPVDLYLVAVSHSRRVYSSALESDGGFTIGLPSGESYIFALVDGKSTATRDDDDFLAGLTFQGVFDIVPLPSAVPSLDFGDVSMSLLAGVATVSQDPLLAVSDLLGGLAGILGDLAGGAGNGSSGTPEVPGDLADIVPPGVEPPLPSPPPDTLTPSFVLSFFSDTDKDGLLDSLEFDRDGNGTPDPFDDANGNGLPDLVDWR